MSTPEPVTDKEWRSRWDAQTLSEAEVIKADQARLDAAQVAAAKLAEDKGEEKRALDKVARTGGKGTPSPKGGQGGQAHTKQKFSPETGGTVLGQGGHNVFERLPRPKGL
jgi:hypothetical protein